MRTAIIVVLLCGIYLTATGCTLAAYACDPDTWLTVNPDRMQWGSIFTVLGIFTIFGAAMLHEGEKLNRIR